MHLLEHRSIRKFLHKPIAQADVDYMVNAGIRASNTANMQAYSIVATTDRAMMAKLKPLHLGQPILDTTQLHLTICADLHRFSRWCLLSEAKPGYGNLLGLLSAIVDAALCAQNIAVAAEEKNLGLCFLGTPLYNPQAFADLLQLPTLSLPVTAICLGYPDEHPGLTERLPKEAVLHKDTYFDPDDSQLLALYHDIDTNPNNRKAAQEAGCSNFAQLFTNLRYPEALYTETSAKLMAFLRKQGFQLE